MNKRTCFSLLILSEPIFDYILFRGTSASSEAKTPLQMEMEANEVYDFLFSVSMEIEVVWL